MERWMLFIVLFLFFAFIIDVNNCWWDSRRRRRRCSPSDCALSPWSSWGECSQTCGDGGVQVRQRTIVKVQTCGGRCFPQKERKPCSNACCPIDCVSSWSSWGSCQGVCGKGLRWRNLTIIKNDYCGGQPCPSNQSQAGTCDLARYWVDFCFFFAFFVVKLDTLYCNAYPIPQFSYIKGKISKMSKQSLIALNVQAEGI